MNSLTLSARFLSERQSRTWLSIAAIAIGVAVLMSQIILGAGKNFVREWPPESYGPGNITVFANGRGTPQNLGALRRLPDVEKVAGELHAYTYLPLRMPKVTNGFVSLNYVGVDFKSSFVKKGYPLLTGRYPHGPREIVVSAKFAEAYAVSVGKKLFLPLPKGAKNHRVVGIFNDTAIGGAPWVPRLALIPRGSLAADFRRPDFDVFQVQAKAGRAPAVVKLIRKTLGPTPTIKLKPKGPVIKHKEGGAERFLTGGAVLFVAGLLIYNSFLISIKQRRRQLGILSAVGAGGRRMRRLVLSEGLLLGGVASTIGVLAGIGMAALIIWLRQPQVGDAEVFTLPLWGPPVSFLLGLGMTLASMAPAARQAAKIKPLAAIYPERQKIVGWLERRGHYFGAPLAAAGLAGVFYLGLTGDSTPVGVPAGGIGIVLFLFGLVLTSPQLVRPLVRLAGAAANAFLGGLGRLAIFSAAKNPGRTGITISTFFIAVTVILGFQAIDKTLALGLMGANPIPPDQIEVNGGLADNVRERLMGIAGVKAMTPVVGASLRLKRYDFKRLAPGFPQPPEVRARAVPPSLNLEGADAAYLKMQGVKIESGRSLTMAMLRKDTVFLTRQVLRDYGLKVGEKLELIESPLGGDPYDLGAIKALFKKAKKESPVIKLKIAGVLAENVDFQTNGIVGRAAISPAPSAGHEGVWRIQVKDANARKSVVKTIARQFSDHPEALISTNKGAWQGPISTPPESGFGSVLGFVGLVMVIGIMSVANTQSANIIERQKELGLLRAVGLANRKLRRMIILESSMLGVLGGIPGVLASMLLSYIFIFGYRAQAQGRFELPYRFPVPIAVEVVAATALAGLIAGYLATRKVTDASIKDALRYE